ncbi:hypothetical protein Ciccas_010076, partial [Cichlidogyrus casuarinus]
YQNYPYSVLKDNIFQGTRSILNQRLLELRNQSRPSVSAPLSGDSDQHSTSQSHDGNDPEDPNVKPPTGAELLRDGALGAENPQALLNSLWLMNRTQFNVGGSLRHKALYWGQFQLITSIDGARVRYCRGHGGSGNNTAMGSGNPATQMSRILTAQNQPICCTGTGKRLPMPFNCVDLFEIYASLRPVDCRGPSDPFYLVPEFNWEHGSGWFKSCGASSQLISRIPRLLGLKPTKEAGVMPTTPVGNVPQSGDSEQLSQTEVGSKEPQDKARQLVQALISQNQALFGNLINPQSLTDVAQQYLKNFQKAFTGAQSNGQHDHQSSTSDEDTASGAENNGAKDDSDEHGSKNGHGEKQRGDGNEAMSDSTSSSRPVSRELPAPNCLIESSSSDHLSSLTTI